ncbi:YbhB/YbcL family Raf kinase inhibitor-like protein [Mesorhizobium sp. CA6]|uniref:YbhB/YbcL family Raf kinase inhibitor-like protein n=1 Tax=Mesorhizobium sp. CA6 TaxID=588500 RepID=UPI001CCEE2DE|nr:YbhB/YbcL family Raf kinase inhibitor-like protein [Mesorhizobium sp. CA6]MBZ9768710.1 YbhB/YbcL family Raf kinase inhibitor-like protein [Mesorhizobium sp. CA6]
MAFTLESPAFENGHTIPEPYVRNGGNLSPPLRWKNAPAGTKSFLLVVEDPDAPRGMFRHWAVYDIAAGRDRLPEGTAGPETFHQAVNDFGNTYYDGPQPPKGHGVHHYHFRLSALDVEALEPGGEPEIANLLAQAEPHMIATADLVGTYESR